MEIKFDDHDVERLGKEIAKNLFTELAPFLQGNQQEEKYLTKEELAEHIGVSPSWIDLRIRDKEIPYIKMGNYRQAHILFNKKEIDQWLKTLSVPVLNTRQAKLKSLKLR